MKPIIALFIMPILETKKHVNYLFKKKHVNYEMMMICDFDIAPL